jgi:hypothetical protein
MFLALALKPSDPSKRHVIITAFSDSPAIKAIEKKSLESVGCFGYRIDSLATGMK